MERLSKVCCGRCSHRREPEKTILNHCTEHTADNDSSDEEETPPWLLNMSARKNVPCSPHLRSYSGHINVQTIKDVNYFGLQDEYVISGSDCGHVFFWDRKSTEITTILHADEDIVNVIEPHPYEPIIAVSGMDNTIKIFSADAKERGRAALNEGIYAPSRHRTEAILVYGLVPQGVIIAEESPGSNLADALGGMDRKGLPTRRRIIDLDNPSRRFVPNSPEQENTSEGEELEEEELEEEEIENESEEEDLVEEDLNE